MDWVVDIARGRWTAVLLLVTGCRIGFDPIATVTGDGGGDSGDAAIDAPPCTFGAWTAPVNLASLNSSSDEWAPTLSDDGLELVFESSRDNGVGEQLWHSVRATRTDPFPAPTILSVLNTAQDDAGPTLSSDRLTVMFTSDRGGQNRLYSATRSTPTSAFGPPALVSGLTTSVVLGPGLSPSGDELVYNDASETQVLRATKTGATWQVVGAYSELGPAGTPCYPDLSHDGLTIYFDGGGGQLWQATRPAIGSSFGTSTMVPVAQTGTDNTDPDIGDGDQTIVFASNRNGGVGMEDLWMATRACN